MATKNLDPEKLEVYEDWIGNNVAFKCPICGKTYVVSAILHRTGRKCPLCGKSTGYVKGGKDSGGSARIEW